MVVTSSEKIPVKLYVLIRHKIPVNKVRCYIIEFDLDLVSHWKEPSDIFRDESFK